MVEEAQSEAHVPAQRIAAAPRSTVSVIAWPLEPVGTFCVRAVSRAAPACRPDLAHP